MNPANVLDNVRIVEYAPSYAQAVADMWNRSQESWGGGSSVRSADNVARELENAGNLKVFLAVHGSEVVGFCSFSHYREDEGALYVPLLNVRPDYHGRKVGRSLILKAVETTVEMGWPRLDLYTWAGNTKAVPMYKKCGFFWEKKDNAVHLMNFIPTVLQTEALQPYLERIDWYADSLRSLDIRPDGRTENGFDYFEYAWEKDGTSLRVEFEKTGRGMRLVETDDYEIHTEIDDHDLVFGSRYPVRYVIRNKSGNRLECTIRGRDDKNLRFRLTQTVQVEDCVVLEGEFELDPVFEEQSNWKMHPTVASEWTINGRKAEFRTGIAPKFPVKVKLEIKGQEQYTGVREEAFLTFENNYKEPASFEFELPESEFVEFGNPRISIRIPPNGKATVPVSYTLHNFGLYSEDVVMKAVPDSGAPVSFIRKLHSIFKGNTGRYGGDIVDNWVAVNGPYTIGLNKTNNELWTSHFQGSHHTWWNFPRIGKPYSSEFSLKKAESVAIYPDGDAMVLAAEYRSKEFAGFALTAFATLQANGIVEHYFEVRNESGERAYDDLFVIDAFYHGENRLVLPYDGHYYDLEDRYAANYDDWDIDRISENWLFSRGEKLTHGFCWDAAAKLVKTEWHFGIEHELGRPADGETVRTRSTYLAIGTYTDWWDFRSYAQKRRDPVRPLLRDHFELSVNDGNPFVSRDAKIEIRQHRNQPFDGVMTLTSATGQPEPIHETYRREDAVRSSAFVLTDMPAGSIHPVRMNFEAEQLRFERTAALIPTAEGPVLREVREGAAGKTYRCSNGALSIEASPVFGAALHSLVYNGEEWLDSSYPEPGPRSWWNPWHGGISATVQGMSPLSQQEEERNAEFVCLTDNRGNDWNGIALHTRMEKHEENRGIGLSLFALLLPGAPVLCCVTRLTNRTGLSYTHFRSTINSFFRPGDKLSEGWMETKEQIRYRCGKAGMDLGSEGVIRFGSYSRTSMLHAVNRYPGSDAWMYTNNLLISHGASQGSVMSVGETIWAFPLFFAFADNPLTYKQLRGLAEIRFDGNGG